MAGTKRKDAAEATRTKILEVARGLFTRQGFMATNLRQVALLSGYSTGAIFSHWGSKEGLFAVCMGEPAPDIPGFLDKLIAADAESQSSDTRSLALYELAKAAKVLRVHMVGTPE